MVCLELIVDVPLVVAGDALDLSQYDYSATSKNSPADATNREEIDKGRKCTPAKKRRRITEEDAHSPDRDTSSLLRLPPKVVALICKLSVVTLGPVKISKDLRLPALTASCRKLRAVSRSMWWALNRFQATDIHEEMLQRLVSLAPLWKGPSVGTRTAMATKVRMTYKETRLSWEDLMIWCQHVHQGKHWSTRSARDDCHDVVLLSALSVAAANRGRSWTSAKHSLDAVRLLAGKLDKAWLVEG